MLLKLNHVDKGTVEETVLTGGFAKGIDKVEETVKGILVEVWLLFKQTEKLKK